MICSLIIQGFKDQDRKVNLSGLDLFTSSGFNGVGKSAILEGFKLALLKGLAAMRQSGFLDNVLVAHYQSVREQEGLCGFAGHILFEREPVEAI